MFSAIEFADKKMEIPMFFEKMKKGEELQLPNFCYFATQLSEMTLKKNGFQSQRRGNVRTVTAGFPDLNVRSSSG